MVNRPGVLVCACEGLVAALLFEVYGVWRMAQRRIPAGSRMGGVSLAALMIAAPMLLATLQEALAQTVTTIDTAETLPRFPSNGDTLVVTESGSITSSVVDTVTGPVGVGTTITVNNAGTIETISSLNTTITTGGSILLTNSGIISGGRDAIRANAIVSLINSGSMTGSDEEAIDAVTITSLINSGIISGGQRAISADTITSLINSGSITGSGDDAIFVTTITSLINSGSITSHDNVGVFATTISSLINSGTIVGRNAGVGATTITSLINSGTITSSSSSGTSIGAATITSLINSGSIRGGTNAIRESGAGDTQLTLLAGSVIDGTIDLGGGINTLNVGSGLSLGSTILTEGSLALELGTTNVPIVILSSAPVGGVVTNQVASIDPTALGLTDEGLADLTGGIFGVLSSRQSGFGSGAYGGGSGISPLGYAPAADEPAAFDAVMANERVRTSWNVWGEVFGSYREQDGSGNATDTTSNVGGLVVGADGAFSDTLTLGGFLGGAWGQSEAENNTQETDTTSVFAGVYGAFVQPGVTYDFALVGGHSSYDRERQVANNLVAGGLETATADYNGWFLSPELTVRGTQFQHFEPFVTLRYAGLFQDDVTETGTAAPLTLESQTLHLATGRLGVTLPYAWTYDDGSETRLRLTGGVEARRQFGGTTQRGVLLGQSIAFEAGDTDTVLGGFVGLDADHQIDVNIALYASGEALFETDNAMQLSGRAGIRVMF
ncbi:MAG: autotransporter domain-containing protein, partial [Pseudomonadota bacterium]